MCEKHPSLLHPYGVTFHFFQYLMPIIYKNYSRLFNMPSSTKICNYTSLAQPTSTEISHNFSIVYGMNVLHQI